MGKINASDKIMF